MKKIPATIAAMLLLAGCGSSGSGVVGGSPPPASTKATTSAVVIPPPKPVDPNMATCSKVQDLLSGYIKDAFNAYKPATNEFDKQFAEKLRTGATRLYGLQPASTGAVTTAIGTEAKGLTDLSVAVENADDSAVIQASNDANSALAQIRGVCHF